MPENCRPPCDALDRLEQRVEEYKSQSSAAHQEMYTRLRVLETASAVQGERYTAILAKQDELITKVDGLSDKVDAIEARPAKRWNGLVDKVLLGIAAVFATALGSAILYLLANVPRT